MTNNSGKIDTQSAKAVSATATVTAIKAFSDNYIWSIGSKASNEIALVDPGDAEVCIEFIERNQLQLTNILITHHHSDHVGGINALVEYCRQHDWPLTVYGPATENIPHCKVKLSEGDQVCLKAPKLSLQVLDVPGHTAGHIAYIGASNSENYLFCGDTLFSGGCGRLFEGTAAQMSASLAKLAALPENTQVFCAHEYTRANLDFAVSVEPDNKDLIHYLHQVKDRRTQGLSTIPSSIGLELKINPFLRCHSPQIIDSARAFSPDEPPSQVATFSAIRALKDQF
ncbi:hydroxyacylglutathione hydrolase [Thalassomonas haliotis]|uniref:Hydroxyacylglutathione hydrolase n=1 Tax=Thalassomonas haliotis TaxID=485448 RepID=A0ABY7V7D6_9GAMM|nr:hydroxyacylglutathione hydrolase [Thalassomonas haliotis]WDE09589.1 hydroxyacylglutathione hydrolase [Thalassomonas haliotis]